MLVSPRRIRLSKMFESLVDEFDLVEKPKPNPTTERWENEDVSIAYSNLTMSLSVDFVESEAQLYLVVPPGRQTDSLSVIALGIIPLSFVRPLARVDERYGNVIREGLYRSGEKRIAEQMELDALARSAGKGPIYGEALS